MKEYMRNFKVEATNNNTYVVRADSNRFGDYQIVFESYKKSECYEYAKNHGAKVLACKHCGHPYIPNRGGQEYCKEHSCQVDRGIIKDFYYNGNFKSRAEEKAHMLELRDRGYNNVEIAKMVGRNLDTVYRNIGKQPKIMTQLSNRLAGERRAKMSQNRKIAVATAKRLEYEKAMQEKAEIEAEQKRIQAEIDKLCRESNIKSMKVTALDHVLRAQKAEYENAMNVLRSA